MSLPSTALYSTIWAALLLFCAGEAGRARVRAGGSPPPWAWWTYTTGAILCMIHIAIAMKVAHGWSHDAAIAATARQTNAVYGLNWGGGVYVNYAFVAVWLVDAWRWRRREFHHTRDLDAVTWATRIFFLIIILNAAVIFASGARRAAGALLVAWLLWLWWPAARAPQPTSSRTD
jgi:hypothetical protein